VIAAITCLAAAFAGAADKPNVILIMTDDQGYGDLSCHGHPVLKTPAMDALHGDSVRLTDFHVDPTCSPSISSMPTTWTFDSSPPRSVSCRRP